MAYRPIDNPKGPNAQVDNIELNTRYDAGAYNYTPPSGTPPDRDTKDVDSKTSFRSSEAPVRSWPIESRRVSTVTPLRAMLLFFDGVLASMPIIFIGKYGPISCYGLTRTYKPESST
jgi:hypothetical protein